MILFVFVLFFISRNAMAQPVKIITFEYPPYMYGDGVGLLEKIFHRISLETGEPLEFQVFPRKRALMMFESPANQEIFLGEREYFPELASSLEFLKVLEIKTVFVYFKNRFPTLKFSDFRDLKGKRVGVSLGTVYVSNFRTAGIIVEEAKLESNLLKLKTNRIDFWHTVDSAATTLIRKKDPTHEKDYSFLPDQIHTVELMVKKGSRAENDFKRIVRGFEIITMNGELQKILDQAE